MNYRSLEKVNKDLSEVEKRISKLQEQKQAALKARKNLLRKERDKLRYVIGGLIMDHLHEINTIYPKLISRLYSYANKRDQIKFVQNDLILDHLPKLTEQNKHECRQSVQEIEAISDLTEENREKFKIIMTAFSDNSKKLKKKIYGREKECRVYTGANQAVYINNELAVYLRDKEGFQV